MRKIIIGSSMALLFACNTIPSHIGDKVFVEEYCDSRMPHEVIHSRMNCKQIKGGVKIVATKDLKDELSWTEEYCHVCMNEKLCEELSKYK